MRGFFFYHQKDKQQLLIRGNNGKNIQNFYDGQAIPNNLFYIGYCHPYIQHSLIKII